MYQEIAQILAIIAITIVGIYPLLSKRTKPPMWYIKGTLGISAVYTIGIVAIVKLGLN